MSSQSEYKLSRVTLLHLLLTHGWEFEVERDAAEHKHLVAETYGVKHSSSAAALRRHLRSEDFKPARPKVVKELTADIFQWAVELEPRFGARTKAGAPRKALFFSFLGPSLAALHVLHDEKMIGSTTRKATSSRKLTEGRNGAL